MAYNPTTYKNTIKTGLLAAIGTPGAEDAFAQILADALGVAISQLESSSGDVTVPGTGLVAPAGGGAVTGSATAALIAPGKIK